MTPHERLDAVARFGFTTRQAGFLVTVMRHSGVCLPRQYAAFAGIAYGHKTNAFFGKLESRRIASTCRCLHNRAVVYHVHHLVSGQPAGVSSAPAALFKAHPAWTLRLVLSGDNDLNHPPYHGLVRHQVEAVFDAVGCERERVEWQVSAHQYSHLAPLVAVPSETRTGVEEGEQVGERPSARPQPPLAYPGSASAESLRVVGPSLAATAKSLSLRHLAGQRDGGIGRRSVPPMSAEPWETGAENGA